MQQPELTIVLVTCNRADLMAVSLRSLMEQRVRAEWPFEIVVIDDGSRDHTPQVLEACVAESPVPLQVVTTTGLGVPGARNLGVSHARGNWIASFDDDQVASPGWLDALREAAERTGALCFGGALSLRLPPGTDEAAFGRRARGLLGEHLISGELQLYPRGVTPATNNALIESVLFREIGGFDTNFKQGGSDTDFFERVLAHGEQIWFVPDAMAEHLIPPMRLEENYLRWTSLKTAATRIRILRKRPGWMPILSLMVQRCGTTVLRDVPQWLAANWRHDATQRLDARCSLWFSEGIFRSVLAYAFPHSAASQRFLDMLDFRRKNGERRSLL